MAYTWSSVWCIVQGLNVDALPLEQTGPLFEHHEMFPARTNTGAQSNVCCRFSQCTVVEQIHEVTDAVNLIHIC